MFLSLSDRQCEPRYEPRAQEPNLLFGLKYCLELSTDWDLGQFRLEVNPQSGSKGYEWMHVEFKCESVKPCETEWHLDGIERWGMIQ